MLTAASQFRSSWTLTGTTVGWAHHALISLPRIRFDQMRLSQPPLVLVASTGLRVRSGDDAIIVYKKIPKKQGIREIQGKFF